MRRFSARSVGVGRSTLKAKDYESIPSADEAWQAAIRVDRLQCAQFTRQLSTMLGAGVPIRQAFEVLERGSTSEDITALMTRILKCVEAGWPLSSAFAAFPRVFNKVYVAMVKVGEETGQLVATLGQLADWLEGEAHLLRRVRGALTYPVIVLAVATLLGIGFFAFLFPSFSDALEGAGSLPLLTRLMVLTSRAFNSLYFWFFAICCGVVLLVSSRAALLRTENRVSVWRFLSTFPLLGALLRDFAAGRFCVSLSLLLGTGVDLLRSFRLASESAGSPFMIDQLPKGLKALSEGSTLWEALQEFPETYSPTVVGLVRIGEESADLPKILHHLADSLRDLTDHRLGLLTALLEPILMALVSVMVGLLVVGVALPMYGMISTL